MFEPYCWSSIWKSSDWWILSSDISDIKLFFCLLKLKKQKAGPNCGGTLRLISLSAAAHLRPLFSVSYSFHCFLLAWEENSANDVQDIQQKAASCEAHWLLWFRPELFWFVTSETACWVNPSHTKKLSQKRISASRVLLPGEMKVRKRNKTEF